MNAPDVFFTGLTLLILSWFVYLGLEDWARRRKLTPEARQRKDKNLTKIYSSGDVPFDPSRFLPTG
jgi:hypothetical protein